MSELVHHLAHYRSHARERRIYKAIVTALICGAMFLAELGLTGPALWVAIAGNLVWIWEA